MTGPVVEDVDGIRWITLDRPENLNAMTRDDLLAITAAVQDAPDEVRAIVLTGSGPKSFTAGMHTTSFEGLDRAGAHELISRVRDAVGAIRLSPKVTAVMINGYCIGAGFEMALAADFRISVPGARVGLPEVKLGIPSVVDAGLLQHHVGLSTAKELILVGDLVDIESLQPSIANRIAPLEQLRQVTIELVSSVTAHTAEVIAAQKDLFESWLNRPMQESIDYSVEVFADVFTHPATAEAISRYRR